MTALLALPESEKNLNRPFLGDGLSVMTAQLVDLAIPTYALLTGGLDARYVRLLDIAQWPPALLLSGMVGGWVQRHQRKTLLGLAGVVSAGELLCMPVTGIAEGNIAKFAVLLVVAHDAGQLRSRVQFSGNDLRDFVRGIETGVRLPEMLGQMASMYATLKAVALISGPVIAFGIMASATVTKAVLLGCAVCAAGSVLLLLLPQRGPVLDA